MLVLVFVAVLASAFKIQYVKAWTGTIYIRADGSIEPSGAPISTSDNVTYTLTGNITSYADGIIVERSDIIIDGGSYMIEGIGNWESFRGIFLKSCNNVTVTNVTVTKFKFGIDIFGIDVFPNSNNIIGNVIENNVVGISLGNSHNNSISGNSITNNRYGIYAVICWNNDISENEIARNKFGILFMDDTSNNRIFGNNVIENECGILFQGDVVLLDVNGTVHKIRSVPSNNRILRNNFTKNYEIYLYQSDCNIISENNIDGGDFKLYYSINNSILGNNINMSYFVFEGSDGIRLFHNNFINVRFHVWSSEVFWDNGYPSGGNYWSDYNGIDIYCGSGQNETGSDGIGDAAYTIDEDNTDRYPLMGHVNIFDVNVSNDTAYSMEVISNSTISNLHFNPEGAFLKFNVIGKNGTTGFCRVAIPKSLLWTENNWLIYVNGEQTTDYKIIPDENISYLYFIYNHTTITATVKGTHAMPISLNIILLTIMTITLIPILRKSLVKNRRAQIKSME